MNAAATILAMSAAQKMRTLDLPMSLLMLVMGIIFIALRKQQAAARHERMKKGELSAEEAEKNGRIFYWGGYVVTAAGLFSLGMWAAGY